MKQLLLSALCALPVLGMGQTLLYNDGATITVQNGATLYVEGGIHNTAMGTIQNNGTIRVRGNLLNQAFLTGSGGTYEFVGNVDSEVTSGSAVFNNVTVSKANANVVLQDNMTINGTLNFNAPGINDAAKIVLNGKDLILGTSAIITPGSYDANEYIATTGAAGLGMVQKPVSANGSFTFPVGDLSNYSPLTSNFTGTGYSSANLRVKANNVVHPNKPAKATDFISRYWDINATGITGYQNTLTGTYVGGDVTGMASLVKGAAYDNTEWSYFDAAAGANTVTGSTSDLIADFTGTNFFGKVDLKVFLHGAYVSGGSMTTTLNTAGIIPLISPYLDAPDTVAFIPANVTDWIKLDLRDPLAPGVVLGAASAFLKNDGTIVGPDGVSLPTIKNGLPVSVVGISHRNHLGIRTPNSGINVVTPSNYDFSAALANAFDNVSITTNDALRLMADNNYVMWGGNANGNNNVRYTTGTGDEAYLLGTALGGNTGTIITGPAAYNGADMNMNAVIRYTTGTGDEAFLLGTVLGGNTGIIINQHQ